MNLHDFFRQTHLKETKLKRKKNKLTKIAGDIRTLLVHVLILQIG